MGRYACNFVPGLFSTKDLWNVSYDKRAPIVWTPVKRGCRSTLFLGGRGSAAHPWRERERESEGERARDAAKQQSRNDDSRSPTETNKQTQPYMLDRQERAFLYALRARDDVAEAGHSGDHTTLNERTKDNQAGYPAGTNQAGWHRAANISSAQPVYICVYIYINMLLPIFEIEVADLPTSSGEAVRCASDSRHEQLWHSSPFHVLCSLATQSALKSRNRLWMLVSLARLARSSLAKFGRAKACPLRWGLNSCLGARSCRFSALQTRWGHKNAEVNALLQPCGLKLGSAVARGVMPC